MGWGHSSQRTIFKTIRQSVQSGCRSPLRTQINQPVSETGRRAGRLQSEKFPKGRGTFFRNCALTRDPL